MNLITIRCGAYRLPRSEFPTPQCLRYWRAGQAVHDRLQIPCTEFLTETLAQNEFVSARIQNEVNLPISEPGVEADQKAIDDLPDHRDVQGLEIHNPRQPAHQLRTEVPPDCLLCPVDNGLFGSYRVVRGGAWNGTVGSLASSSRGSAFPAFEIGDVGWRDLGMA